jgi:hypothetical protein
MRTIMALGTAALLALFVVVGWVTQTALSVDQATPRAASAKSVDPFELMKTSNGLQQQQYDAF